MKKIKIIYWISTGLFAAFMLFSGVQNAISTNDSIKLMHDQLGYPLYFIPFIGIAKLIGAITLVIPGIPRIKEWAYTGLMIDLIGAMYSLMMIGGGIQAFVFMCIPIIIGVISYIYHHKKLVAIDN